MQPGSNPLLATKAEQISVCVSPQNPSADVESPQAHADRADGSLVQNFQMFCRVLTPLLLAGKDDACLMLSRLISEYRRRISELEPDPLLWHGKQQKQ